MRANDELSSFLSKKKEDENKIYIILPKTIFSRKRLTVRPGTGKFSRINGLLYFCFSFFYDYIISRWCFYRSRPSFSRCLHSNCLYVFVVADRMHEKSSTPSSWYYYYCSYGLCGSHRSMRLLFSVFFFMKVIVHEPITGINILQHSVHWKALKIQCVHRELPRVSYIISVKTECCR